MRANMIVAIATVLLGFTSAAEAGPKIQHWQAASGAQVYFVENHDLPMLDVAVNFYAGSGFDSAEKSGLASLTYRLLLPTR